MRSCQGRLPGEGAAGLHLKGLGSAKVKGKRDMVRVCGKSLHSSQRDEHEQWQEIRDQVEERWAVLDAEPQSWKEAKDGAAETIRGQHEKGNKDARIENDLWAPIMDGDAQREGCQLGHILMNSIWAI